MSGNRTRVVLAGGVAVAMTLLTGCLSSETPSNGGGAAGTGSFVDGGSADNDKKVTMLGTFGGDEEKNFLAALAPFEESSGIDIQYTADRDFATTIKQKVNSGDAPDIGLFAQPGGLMEFATTNKVQPLDTFIDVGSLESSLVPGLLDSARNNGRVYGAPMKMAGKSLVWYPKKAYTAGGYPTEPATMTELQTEVADKIKASGASPWCMGWESAQDTGWVGTDWIEQYVLGMHGPEVYDQWTTHKIPFNDERIVQAFDEFAKLAKGDGYVLGGPKGVLSTPFGEAMLPAFSDPPRCFLERQGNFVTSFLPENVQANLADEVGVFAFPTFEGGFEGRAMVGAADIAALFNGNDPDAQEVMKFLSSADFGKEWATAGGWLSPHKTFDTSLYPDEITKQVAEIVANADVFRFDGSDLMPKAVGSGTFWSELIKWENGQSSKETADNIEASWPK